MRGRVCGLVWVLACGGGSGGGVGLDGSVPDGSVDGALVDGALDAGDRSDAGDDAGEGSDAGRTSCPATPTCDDAPPDPGESTDWVHPIQSGATTTLGSARHRGRDLILAPTDTQLALAKFAYGANDDDLQDEDVDVWLQRDCAGAWEKLGTVRTSEDGDNPTVYGVEDTGGWVFFEVPESARLGVGRHRFHFVVKGDLTTADQLVEIVSPSSRFVVSDVDGTLTESENAEVLTLLNGPSPAVQPGAPEALSALASRGYRILYLTARPGWLTTRTHEWLDERGLPPGLVHTTFTFTGALNEAAATFKREELAALGATLGRTIDFGIGNRESDAAAYVEADIVPEHRLLYRLEGDAMGGVVFDDYRDLVAGFEALPLVCE